MPPETNEPEAYSSTAFRDWRDPLLELADGVREATCARIAEACAAGDDEELRRPVSVGAGDVTFGLDVPSEAWIDAWLERTARRGPLSVLTEDGGWRHRGPDPRAGGGVVPLAGFDHGGPRIAIDPVDGTRNLMADLRPAWTVVSFAPPGPGEPRFSDLTGGIVSEIPTSRTARFLAFVGDGASCERRERECSDGALLSVRTVRVDADDRPDHGYFPFFRYKPEQRPALAALEAAFFERLARHEGADTRCVYDDQYISNAGQLVLLLSGTYRLIVDARALVARIQGTSTVTSKPYDVGGAIVCARSAGAVVTAADGGPLDFPMDARTPVHMAGFANEATYRRLAPHWRAVLDEWASGASRS